MSSQSVLLDLPPLMAAIDQNPLQLQSNVDLLTAIRLMDLSPQGKYLLIMADETFQGIFTDRDVVKAVAAGQDLRHTILADLLPNQSIFLTMDADQTILTALAVLYRHQLTYLPVLTAAGHVLGVVTQTTLVQTLNRIEERTAAVALANAQLEQEIAERRRIEISLQETTDRYRSIMAALDTGIVFQGADGGILTCNPSAAQILGMSMASVVESSSFSQHWQPIHEDGSAFPGADHPSMLPFRTGLSYRDVIMGLVQPDESVTWISINSRPLLREGETIPYAVVASFTDITEKKQREQHFLRAQRLEILGTLASGIAHDMNNIFTPILAASQLLPLAIPNLDGRGLRLVKMLEESAHRGSDLVQQILAFAQGTESEHKPIEIIPVLSSVLCVARQTFSGSIEVIEDFADQPLRLVIADSTQIHQVLMNLLVNARDAMPQGGKLTIMARNLDLDANASHVHPDAQSGSYVAITVSDSGMGIARKHLEKILDPFFTTKGVKQGTGLGLSTVVTILKNHGGFLLVSSEVGQGSDFQVCLPCEN
jgi:two-component system, cell cycle sensor histidine kinase and response regulator CckA